MSKGMEKHNEHANNEAVTSLEIYKASDVVGNLIDNVTINIGGDIDTEPNCHKVLLKEGIDLCDLLYKTLPGATLDSLLSEMMRRRASLLIVPLNRE